MTTHKEKMLSRAIIMTAAALILCGPVVIGFYQSVYNPAMQLTSFADLQK